MGLISLLIAALAAPVLETETPAGPFADEGVAWSDNNGRNRLVWAKTEPPCADGGACGQARLWVSHEVIEAGNRYVLNEHVVDFECLDDGGVDLLEPTISDVDEDGIGEIAFGVRVGCVTDLSPLAVEVHLWEGHERHVLYGQTPAWGPLVSPGTPTFGASVMKRAEHRFRLLEVYQTYSREEVRARGAELVPIGFVEAIGSLDHAREVEMRELLETSRPSVLDR